ncbi:uncharacterized protein MONOS_15466 [Monocercomonoides exilis]|uniref:uncharacterized protein n=1 Tax=Monocercomonoides exilis TaxID=2049356 RepID=UPI00355A39D3|nr:hypothetical protein MONOS_15466 [Monocercomonoides exilis]|eukprot:MONOS_15466.1-p1 / transcript=MONOS_15466.1 / gene=MONOS_15466 / organism=Monocercomonoides_exilis_PA203 / gene_product=unspecified product / transcript_product=unspecified product / location=Mono_scaffold01241:579-962(-) / protein_length=128 / sequence_SO=supercontig / SO=protein_coding / is_pseudo=false
MITRALQEARTVRIQGRFGFRAATAMSTDASTGILTERQELILKETRQEAKLERGFQRPVLPITRVQAPVREQPGTLQRRYSYPISHTNTRFFRRYPRSSALARRQQFGRRRNQSSWSRRPGGRQQF